jgi:hypothetical protein
VAPAAAAAVAALAVTVESNWKFCLIQYY